MALREQTKEGVQNVRPLFKEPETSFWKGTAVPKIQIVVTWLPPSQGWTKLNTDGSVQGPQNVTLVGIIRDEKGCWISGFSKKVGIAFSFAVDLWGVYEGLCLARKIGLVVVEVNIDCQAVVDSLCGSKTGCAVGCRLINSIRSMINTSWLVVFKHSYQETNKCVDALARNALVVFKHS
ncbi:Putative ribonuclease H protein [Glycine soja]|uniref:Putative ribonuclease H protein n=1 Tax=Glycine soja TaxID=3848 RepID=A0A0B2SCE9_GLYSO|nr:Putative ribonuclease H protein [Glycine soja]